MVVWLQSTTVRWWKHFPQLLHVQGINDVRKIDTHTAE